MYICVFELICKNCFDGFAPLFTDSVWPWFPMKLPYEAHGMSLNGFMRF